MTVTEWHTAPKDLEILRRLGERKRAIAEDPVNLERKPGRVLVYAFKEIAAVATAPSQ